MPEVIGLVGLTIEEFDDVYGNGGEDGVEVATAELFVNGLGVRESMREVIELIGMGIELFAEVTG